MAGQCHGLIQQPARRHRETCPARRSSADPPGLTGQSCPRRADLRHDCPVAVSRPAARPRQGGSRSTPPPPRGRSATPRRHGRRPRGKAPASLPLPVAPAPAARTATSRDRERGLVDAPGRRSPAPPRSRPARSASSLVMSHAWRSASRWSAPSTSIAASTSRSMRSTSPMRLPSERRTTRLTRRRGQPASSSATVRTRTSIGDRTPLAPAPAPTPRRRDLRALRCARGEAPTAGVSDVIRPASAHSRTTSASRSAWRRISSNTARSGTTTRTP